VVLSCIFHPSQLLLVSGGDDSQIKIWDLISKTCVATLQAHFSAVTSLAISEDGWTLLSAGRDGVVVLWNLKNYARIATIPVHEALEAVVALPSKATPSPGGSDSESHGLLFATGGEKGAVKVWSSSTARCVSDELPSMPAPTEAGSIVELATACAESPYDLVAATQDGRVLLLSLLSSPANDACAADTATQDSVEDLKKKRKKRKISGKKDKTTMTPAAAMTKKIGLFRQFIGNNDEVTDLKFSTNGSRLAVSTNSEHVHVYDAKTLGCLDALTGHNEAVLSLDCTRKSVRPDSAMDLLASGSKDNTVRLWNISNVPDEKGCCLAVGTGHVSAVTGVAFSTSGSFLVSSGADKLLRVWDVARVLDTRNAMVKSASQGGNTNDTPLPALAAIPAHDKDINAVCISPNDQLVASASQDKTIKLWRMPDLTPVTVLRGHRRGIWSIAFSPIDQAIASASGDKTIKLWNIKDGSCLRTFEGHVASVLKVQFLSAGTQLLSAGADGLVKLWNVRTAECIGTFDGHEDKIWALALGDKDGDVVASGGSDGSIAVWKDSTEADRETALKDAETETMREQELDNAVHDEKWEEAARLAIAIGRPGRLLSVVRRALNLDDADGILLTVAKSFDEEQLKKALEYCREWNTHSKNCGCAQAMLHAILSEHSPDKLLAVPGFDGIADGIEAYTKRHRSRVDRLLRSAYVVDFILGGMGMLLDDDPNGPGDLHGLEEKRKVPAT
jgi:U3 small nucleolar RNA-associated protein 13